MRITEHIAKTEEFAKLKDTIRAGKVPCSVFGVPDSLKPYLPAAISETFARPVIVVCASEEKAESFAEAAPGAVYIPKRPLQLRSSVARSREMMFKRIDSISRLVSGKTRLAFLCVEALAARLAPKEDFLGAHITIEKGGVYDPEKIIQQLVLMGYERVGAVETAGQAARRGEILDVFCPGEMSPYRIDFFDNIVESIHEFDPGSQRRSKRARNKIVVKPAVELVLSESVAKKSAEYFKKIHTDSQTLSFKFKEYARGIGKRRFFEDMENYAYVFCSSTLFDYLPTALVIFDDYKRVKEDAKECNEAYNQRLKILINNNEAITDQQVLYHSFPEIIARSKKHDVFDFCVIDKSSDLNPKSEIRVHAKNALSYNKKLDILSQDIKTRVKNGWRVYLVCGNLQRADKLSYDLTEKGLSVPCIKSGRDLYQGEVATYPDKLIFGFELSTLKTYFLGEHEIFGFVKKRNRSSSRKRLDVFADLKTGDMIVHDVHGKGRFLGLVKKEVQGISRDYIKLEYRDGDKLFIPTDQIDRVQKYMGGEGERLSKLGGKEWGQTKARVKKSLKALAEDLVSIYSERLNKKGYKYGEDTIWQKQFEDNFPYEETEGQIKSNEEIKKDMQQDKVMDRLLLGDVGYGKTEVAMRACFKAVMEGRQCAVLVPTTLLARQHYHTFSERFGEFAVQIETISRYVSASDQKRILQGIKAGTVDVVIGTHRLLSRDVVFKDLGLLVIDEEHRFGVSHKERIKDLKRSVDVLTLSATPIPRTLQMSLTGIRDMSLIDTPPEDRKAPESYVMEYSGQLVREAVLSEMERDGQVYFVCRQIALMDKLMGDLIRYVPEARVAKAHGRMGEAAIEKVMVDFMAGGYDVLLCTTIIESGIDIPSVNTVIVYEADKFGLAQLYQLKGRVGRATQSSYAYLTYLPGTHMTTEAEKRLQTIAEFTELGAGFKVAMRDLEIRGAGNLLGPEQSGQMAAVGYDMYCRLMREAVAEIRGQKTEPISDASVEIKINAYVPSTYIKDEILRIEAYKKIAAVDGMQSAKQIKEEIADRYGAVPKPVENLILISLIKSFALRAGIVSVTRNGRVFTLKYGEESRLNVNKLLKVLEQYKNMAQLKSAIPPYIVFKAQTNAIDALLKFLKEARRCIIHEHKV
ncbi:MAG: transcription-repair coupling factor [Christensenellales bacterium]|jgi:transcription-repair coupling factor (superfamily II helicase)